MGNSAIDTRQGGGAGVVVDFFENPDRVTWNVMLDYRYQYYLL